MQKKLSIRKSLSIIRKGKRTLRMIFVSVFTFAGTLAMGQTNVTVPNDNLVAAFLGPLSNSARTYQMIIDDTMLTALNGKYINSIAFRLPASVSNPWPATATTYSSYEIWLSDGVDPANRQLDFLANVVGTQTMARSGTLTFPVGVMTTGTNPNAFSYDIMLDTPWLYTGTNLVIEIRHSGSNASSTSVHAAPATSNRYGIDYTACWRGTGNVAQGNFAYVKINAQDNMGVHSVEIDPELTVYPNPAKDEIFVKSTVQYRFAEVVNYAGQTVLRRELNSLQRINVSELATGNYILKLSEREGQSVVTKFIKQ